MDILQCIVQTMEYPTTKCMTQPFIEPLSNVVFNEIIQSTTVQFIQSSDIVIEKNASESIAILGKIKLCVGREDVIE